MFNMKYGFLLLLTSFTAFAAEPMEWTIKPGEVRWVEFNVPDKKAKLFCRDAEVKITIKENMATAVVQETYFSDMKPYDCEVKVEGKVVKSLRFKIVEKEFEAEQLKVDGKRILLSAKNQKRADEEQVILNKIYASSPDKLYFEKAFMVPLSSTVTSVYGIRRVYNKQKKGQHLGTDFRAAIGVKIPAANKGKVVFSGDLFYTGGTVILDHGQDIFTVYGHLSKPTAKLGSIVDRGDIIGLSGNTGRTSGPHLHWGVKVQGQYIDGMSLVSETKKHLVD